MASLVHPNYNPASCARGLTFLRRRTSPPSVAVGYADRRCCQTASEELNEDHLGELARRSGLVPVVFNRRSEDIQAVLEWVIDRVRYPAGEWVPAWGSTPYHRNYTSARSPYRRA